MAASFESLQLNLLKFFHKGQLTDVTINCQGRELKAHKVMLAAQSEFFFNSFIANPNAPATMDLDRNWKAVNTLINFMYFGGLSDESLGPYDGLDMLELCEELGVHALTQEELAPFVSPRLTLMNSIQVLQHPALDKYPIIKEDVCHFVGTHFLQMLNSMEDQLYTIPRAYLPAVLRTACHHIASDPDVKRVVAFCLHHSKIDSSCDLLRDTKQWEWATVSTLKPLPEEQAVQGDEAGDCWTIFNVKAAMDSTPARVVEGSFFDWTIRLDYGGENKLRIVYESACPRHDTPRCINRFPAAMFAWRVVYRGQDVFNEKPVFICFPEGVQLHWSTTLPVNAVDLSDDDSLQIMVNMAENPLLSLVLYYFSSDLKSTVMNEDILNRLPHTEYRCLSSYSLVQTHVQQK